jgi:hypothetical protein
MEQKTLENIPVNFGRFPFKTWETISLKNLLLYLLKDDMFFVAFWLSLYFRDNFQLLIVNNNMTNNCEYMVFCFL